MNENEMRPVIEKNEERRIPIQNQGKRWIYRRTV